MTVWAAPGPAATAEQTLVRRSGLQILRDGGFVRKSMAMVWGVLDTGPAAAGRVLKRLEHARTGRPPTPLLLAQNTLYSQLILINCTYAPDLQNCQAAADHITDLLTTAPHSKDQCRFLCALFQQLFCEKSRPKGALAAAALSCAHKPLGHRLQRASLQPKPPARTHPYSTRSLEAVLWAWPRVFSWEKGILLAKRLSFTRDETVLLLALCSASRGLSFVPTTVLLKLAHSPDGPTLYKDLAELRSEGCLASVPPLERFQSVSTRRRSQKIESCRRKDALPPQLPSVPSND